jgi:hypothetical protein
MCSCASGVWLVLFSFDKKLRFEFLQLNIGNNQDVNNITIKFETHFLGEDNKFILLNYFLFLVDKIFTCLLITVTVTVF